MIKNRLVLIDSFALIYRAFYGIPASLTRDNHPINAAYGFASALLSAIKELQPEYMVAGFDLPKPTKRHIDFVDYKAHRKPMPDDLIPQIQYCKRILEVMNIPMVAAEGYEGEDIIATVVAQCKMQKSKCKIEEYIIVTGDSDTFQLIDSQTKVYSMARGAQHAVLYDENKVQERYGLPAADFVDYKALKGDTSDNIPGVPGIGEKTAASLIQKFRSLDNIYEKITNNQKPITNQIPITKEEKTESGQTIKRDEKIDEENLKNLSKELKISEKVIRLLIEHKEQAYLSQKLSQIQNNAPIEFNLPAARVHDFDQKKVEKLFNDLGFKSLLARMPVSTRENNQQALF